MGTKTITMYVSDLDQSEIPAGQVYQLSIRHPDGATQQLDISEKNYRSRAPAWSIGLLVSRPKLRTYGSYRLSERFMAIRPRLFASLLVTDKP